MKLTVSNCDTKTVQLNIKRKNVKVKVNRNWSDDVKAEVEATVRDIAESVIERNLQSALIAEFNPGDREITLRTNNKTSPKVYNVELAA